METFGMPATFKNGSLVLFGASTTALRPGVKTFGEFLEETFARWQWPVKIVNSGVRGNSTELAKERFNRDVIDQNPSLVVIMLGINDSTIDVWKEPPASAPRVSLSRFRENLEFFVDELQGRGVGVLLMTPHALQWTESLLERYGRPPYLPEKEQGFNIFLKEYVEAIRGIAKEKQIPLIDLFSVFSEMPASQAKSLLLSDGMHPNTEGHALIHELLLVELLKLSSEPPR